MTRLPAIWEEPFRLLSDVERFMKGFDSEQGLITGYGRTDIYEKDGHLCFELELPGMKKEELKASIEDDRLVIKGEIKRDTKVNEDNYLRMERRYGTFQKNFPIPAEADRTDLTASFQDGILKISIPLKQSLKRETVDIQIY